ncbi:cupredoxin domain-containing protein [Rhabdothermincola sp.]|uniref:cupredoxin domain-containing protein n=1 Tax=Rhabdothermincola sp. TaxID=2820405 RepID=UPI002FE387FA
MSTPRRAVTAAATATLAVALTASLAGCSSGGRGGGSDADRAAPPPTTAGATGAPAPTTGPRSSAPNACDSKMPGEVMTAEEAVVRFSDQQVCPGYVTVALGTPVTWRNTGQATYTVTIKDGPLPTSAELRRERVEPGASVAVELPSGQFAWTTDALEAFVGTVEVQG